ncbi:peptidyl-prolyl cis-trans isomerase SurA [Bartonella australis AUST/NH1]|uniref:Peptidyl-prolyl cis-trans isomerase SurA n=1 Tax=Bartonella australis (strain Aust/NH1) TaxID=1094489 RepID=M1N356_BARAA|nr:peptidylprolyl isomerase [Bartonella australis]AGF74349.1 peptidyl-prolyl cis-trans isomerase SurA [Bartonella australis AUST/NH1]
MNKFKNNALALFYIIALNVGGLFVSAFFALPAFAQSEIAVVVNGNAITNYDIQRRASFLKLQQKQGNLLAQAKNELIDEMLKNIELKNRDIEVSDDEVNSAFEAFVTQNHMTFDQINEILAQFDLTEGYFKAYIRGQIGWGRLVSARYQAENVLLTEQEVAHRILKNGGVKPSTNEYTLQQIIFVIPARRRSEILGRRQYEANNFRAHFRGCNNTRNQAKGILDVTIRDLGKMLEPQLPSGWEGAIRATPIGKMTKPQETQNGIEAVAVCQIKRVSDDRVAQLIFSIQDNQKNISGKLEALNGKYLKELRQRARIQES